mgnify:CR=1 FL=1
MPSFVFEVNGILCFGLRSVRFFGIYVPELIIQLREDTALIYSETNPPRFSALCFSARFVGSFPEN